MSLAISTSPSSPASSAASTSPIPPPTPLTPSSTANSYSLSTEQFPNFDSLDANNQTASAQQTASGQVGPVRRKPSRRANTAERRATHNAVERQRRETLNGRFLDLAALLPNLTSVRRPSKSAIVNSSIALIHSQRRVRSNAARELRLLRHEADQLRAEVNEWRERSGMPRVEEPIRTREFEEMLTMEESDEDLEQAERRAMDMAKESLRIDALNTDLDGPFAFSGMGLYGGMPEDDEDGSSDHGRPRPPSQGSSVGSVPSLPLNIPVPRQGSISSNPLIFDPSSALLQNHHTHQGGISAYSNFDLGNNPHPALALASIPPSGPQEKLAAWNATMYNLTAPQNQWSAQQQQPPQNYQAINVPANMFTPPTSAHSAGGFIPGYDDNRSAFSSGPTTPPSSAPASATSYSDAGMGPGDAFAAAYGAAFNVGPNAWKHSAKVDAGITSGNGGGSGGLHYGAAMSLFM